LACAVAIANLEIFERERVVQRVQARAAELSEQLRGFAELPHVGDIRQWGLMVGIELVRDVRRRTAYDPADRMGARVAAEARGHGVIVRPLGDVIVLMPPLSITSEQLGDLCHAVRQAIIVTTG
jgi:adenosylmethionine-8-amino-7-oxononanoate aminotransferase